MTPYDRLAALGLTLPKPMAPAANYVPFVISGSSLYVSGQGPVDAVGSLRIGRVGQDRTAEEAYDDARITGLMLLAQTHAALGDLGRVARVVKLLGMVHSTPDFKDHPKVINGCSDLLVAVFGEAGRHARSAVGVGSLPWGISVEIEAIFEIA
jgi:enamine deaminase RidA (YjgF/YER057c/UK114 family)